MITLDCRLNVVCARLERYCCPVVSLYRIVCCRGQLEEARARAFEAEDALERLRQQSLVSHRCTAVRVKPVPPAVLVYLFFMCVYCVY